MGELAVFGGVQIARLAAHHFLALRRRGISVRKGIDHVIVTWCISQGMTLLHNDRDVPMAQHVVLP